MESKGIFNCLSDKTYLKLMYRLRIGKKLNLDNPKTFNEKLQWLKLYDRKPEYTNLVDKYEVKKIVADKIGEEYIIPTLGVWDKFDDIDFDKLPNQFVLKCTHDSGGLVICKDKSQFNVKSAKKRINKCLKRDYFKHGREWPYKNVKPRIIAEEYIGTDLVDYKFLCNNGKVKNMFTCSGRGEGRLFVDFFDLNWNHLDFERHYPNSEIELKKPKKFEKMIELSEILSKELLFVRIDFYNIDGKIYFGEITFYPGSGFEEFTPDEWDLKLGEFLELNN